MANVVSSDIISESDMAHIRSAQNRIYTQIGFVICCDFGVDGKAYSVSTVPFFDWNHDHWIRNTMFTADDVF